MERNVKKILLGTFFVPRRFEMRQVQDNQYKAAAIVPSFKPGEITVRLVEDLIRWNENLLVYVVNDSTPEEYELKHHIFERISKISPRAIVLKTPENKLKAGAINFALRRIFSAQDAPTPDVIITLDDDVIVSANTVKKLTCNLFEDDRLGAVCSQCRVINKNANFLTRLQGLEYLGFNGMRLADEGFFWGPLVMHGMLTAFRTSVFQEVGLFAERHLIEDYELTVRMKIKNWHVRLATASYAWTKVPEKFVDLWRQRTRWMVGGLFIVADRRYWRVIIQDVIGHLLFLSTFFCIFASLVLRGAPGSVPKSMPIIIIVISLTQVILWYFFQIWFMRFYLEKDWKDWLIRVSLVPEFFYANILSIVLLGSYSFYVFQRSFARIEEKSRILNTVKLISEKMFSRIGYTNKWGTR